MDSGPADPKFPSPRAAGAGWTQLGFPARGLMRLLVVAYVCASPLVLVANAQATPSLTIDANSGAVLFEDQAALPWYPASLTKMMTAYVALDAVRQQKITLDTPLVVSARAAAMPPSKMGFRPGTLVTLHNALKMLMVKSANDIAVTIAEGVSGSVEAFAEDMNQAAVSLGLRQSHFVNPNGLPHPQHFSSARDMAIIARALYLRFPDQADLFGIGALRFGDAVIRNHNNLLGRYPGADGVKTGFTCAAGFNIAVSASQSGRKVIAVVLGAPSVEARTVRAAALLDRAFAGVDQPSGSVMSLEAPPGAAPPDMHGQICQKRGKAVVEFNAGTERMIAPLISAGQHASPSNENAAAYAATAFDRAVPMALRIGMVPSPAFDPVPVQIGAPEAYAGPIAQAREPHSPVGTEPPAAAQAYAAIPESSFIEGSAPLTPDGAALSMHRRGKHVPAATAHRPARAHVAQKPQKHVAGKASAAAKSRVQHSKAAKASAAKPKPAAKAKAGVKTAKH